MKRTLIKCGWLVTLDDAIGDFHGAELLIEDSRIAAVGKSLNAAADAVIDATDKIVMPGLVNAHMHTWETALRGIAAEWLSAGYMKNIHGNLATHYQPEDNYM
jgi:5-methylthioadenosine/S-adenosylhomocysteine deaminase